MNNDLAQQPMSDAMIKFAAIASIAQDLWKDTYVSAMGHIFAADSWTNIHLALGIVSTVLAAAIGASIFSQAEHLVAISGVISLIVVVATALSTFLNAEKRSVSHHQVGANYLALSNKVAILVTVSMTLKKKNYEDIANELIKLSQEREELLKDSPPLSARFRNLAKKNWDASEKERQEKLSSMRT